MKYVLVIKEPVKLEITEAFNYYENKQAELGNKLLDAIEETLLDIKSNPLIYQIKYDVYRTILVKPFPYILIYEVLNNEVIVYQFFNAKRNPSFRFEKK